MINYKIIMHDKTVIHVQANHVEHALFGAYEKTVLAANTDKTFNEWVKNVATVTCEEQE